MNELYYAELEGYTIIEHRAGGENIVGKIESSGVNDDGSFGVCWHHHDGGRQATLFKPTSWQCDIVETVIFLKRIAEDPNEFNIPWRESDLYTIFLTASR